MLQRAIDLATMAHLGQKDKAGNDYIEHPKAVMALADTEKKKVVAVLHDIVEDTEVTLETIDVMFGKAIRDAVDAITRRKKS